MKKLLILSALMMGAVVALGQTKSKKHNQGIQLADMSTVDYRTLYPAKDTIKIQNFAPLILQNVKMISGDTTYSGDKYSAFQTITCEIIFQGKSSILTVINKYDGKNWIFDSCSFRANEGFIFYNSTPAQLTPLYFK